MITENEYIAEQLFKEFKEIAKENNKEKIKKFIDNNPILKDFYDIDYLLNI